MFPKNLCEVYLGFGVSSILLRACGVHQRPLDYLLGALHSLTPEQRVQNWARYDSMRHYAEAARLLRGGGGRGLS